MLIDDPFSIARFDYRRVISQSNMDKVVLREKQFSRIQHHPAILESSLAGTSSINGPFAIAIAMLKHRRVGETVFLEVRAVNSHKDLGKPGKNERTFACFFLGEGGGAELC